MSLWNSCGEQTWCEHQLNFSSTHRRCLQKRVSPSQFKGTIIFMPMYNDVIWWHDHNEDLCQQKAILVASLTKDFDQGRWSFLCLGDEEKWCGSLTDKRLVKWNSTSEIAMQEFAESAHLVCKCSPPHSRGLLKIKGGGRTSIHFQR